jgi:hypothetical protein
MGRAGPEPACKSALFPGRGQHRTAPGEHERLRKQRRIVGFGLVNQDVGVGVSGQGQVYFGWYAWNVLELDARDIALHFGHQDGGDRPRQSRSSLRV